MNNKTFKNIKLDTPYIDDDIYYHLKNLDDLNFEEFEDFLCELFTFDNYKVNKLSKRNHPDGGIDMIISKGNEKIAVQAKAWKVGGKNAVGVEIVRNLLGAMDTQHINKGLIITTNYFTGNAKDEAAKNSKITLIDREKLYNLIAKLHPMLLSKVYYETVLESKGICKCPKCGNVLLKKYNNKSKKSYYGCSNYPNCNYTKD